MKNESLMIKFVHVTLITAAATVSPLWADCLEFHHAEDDHAWSMDAAVIYESTKLESTDNYLSGNTGTEDWKAVNDVNGSMYGIEVDVIPPVLGKRVAIDFAYLTGKLDGNFNTTETAPTPEGPYEGTVDYDREEWELGADIFILNAVYARLAYSTFEMDGDWVYTDGSMEPQKYEYYSVSVGAGFRQKYEVDELQAVSESNFGFIIDAFLGLSHFEYKHTEQDGGASAKSDGLGYIARAELLGTYDIELAGGSYVYAGIGYNYNQNDADDDDLTQQGFLTKLGLAVTF